MQLIVAGSCPTLDQGSLEPPAIQADRDVLRGCMDRDVSLVTGSTRAKRLFDIINSKT